MSSKKKAKEQRRALMLSAVEEQMNSPESPDVRVHYDRLRALGHTDEQTREMIAAILAFYIWHQMRGDGYSYADYVAELARLPKINWQQGGDEID